MKFYIANVSRHDRVFNYRLPEKPRPIAQPIRMGAQSTLPGDLSTPEVEALIDQVSRLGGKRATSYSGSSEVIPFLYEVDKPVPAVAMRDVMRHNTGQITLEGRRMREAAAIATSQAIESALPGALTNLEMTVQEETEPQIGDKPIAEGVIVDTGRKRPGEDDAPSETRRRRRRR